MIQRLLQAQLRFDSIPTYALGCTVLSMCYIQVLRGYYLFPVHLPSGVDRPALSSPSQFTPFLQLEQFDVVAVQEGKGQYIPIQSSLFAQGLTAVAKL
jgi:hypothetical protein